MTEKTARFGLAVVLPVIIAAVGFLPMLLISDLPERFASHFDGSGLPDGSMTLTQLAVTTGVMVTIGLVFCIGVGLWRKPLPALVAPTAAGTGAFVAGMGAAIAATTVIGQRNLTDFNEAELGALTFVSVIASAAVAGLAAGWLAKALPTQADTMPEGATPTMALAEGERAVWVGDQSSALLFGIGALSLAVFVTMAVIGAPWLAVLVVALATVTFLALARVRVRTDGSGLHVVFGGLPWPRTHLAIEDIESASVIDVRPKDWGGWGYRGSLKLLDQAGVIYRAGPGLRVNLRNGKTFVVTIDNPEMGAAILNAEVARLPNQTTPA